MDLAFKERSDSSTDAPESATPWDREVADEQRDRYVELRSHYPQYNKSRNKAITLQDGNVFFDSGDGYSNEIYHSATDVFSDVPSASPSNRFWHQAVLLNNGNVMSIGGYTFSATNSTQIYDSILGLVSSGPSMGAQRFEFTATVLSDGKVLVAGGLQGASWAPTYISSTEIYDSSFNPGPSLSKQRGYHTATRLTDGRVLIAGGIAVGEGEATSTEIYDPLTNTFSAGPAMTLSRYWHSAILLADGRVLIAGGEGAAGTTTNLFDPVLNTFSAGPSMSVISRYPQMVLLPDGRVFMSGYINGGGGLGSQVDIFDPNTNTITAGPPLPFSGFAGGASFNLLSNNKVLFVGNMYKALYDTTTDSWDPVIEIPSSALYSATLAKMADGKVMALGGSDAVGMPSLQTEIYDPALNIVSAGPNMLEAHTNHTVNLLTSGKLFVAGGTNLSGVLATTEIYDDVLNSFSAGPVMNTGRYHHESVLLSDGRVWLSGGSGNLGDLQSTEIFNPVGNSMSAGPSLLEPRMWHSGVLMSDGRVLIAGGYNGTTGDLQSTEVYNPVLNTIIPGPPRSESSRYISMTAMGNGKVLIVNSSSTDIYDPLTNTISPGPALLSYRDTPESVLLPDGRVHILGGAGVKTTEIYNPETNTITQSTTQLVDARYNGYVRMSVPLESGAVLLWGGSYPGEVPFLETTVAR